MRVAVVEQWLAGGGEARVHDRYYFLDELRCAFPVLKLLHFGNILPQQLKTQNISLPHTSNHALLPTLKLPLLPPGRL